MDCGDHPALRVNRVDSEGVGGEKPPKFFQVLEFIGHQGTSSGCGLMGLGEKILSLWSGGTDNASRFGPGGQITLADLVLPPQIWSG